MYNCLPAPVIEDGEIGLCEIGYKLAILRDLHVHADV
jgi:hypothetical protein